MATRFDVLGRSHVRKDAVEKVTGGARYIPDISLPRMLHARFLRSPHAHARIGNIFTARAAALPGVACILTHRDVPAHHPQRRMGLLLDGTVHYQGEEVAAVAAETPEIAEEALALIEVEYEILPAVFDPAEALKDGAPPARAELGGNIFKGTPFIKFPRLGEDGRLLLEFGDVEQGFAEADHILEGDYESPMQYNCSPSPRAVVCEWTGDKLTCRADTQLPLNLHKDLSACLKIPMSDIRLVSQYAVGGYGAKSPDKIANLTAIMARKTRRPVKAVYTRSEDIIATHHRISYQIRHKAGVKNDGTITALQSSIVGHWGSDTASPCIAQAAAILTGCSLLYQAQSTRAETYGVVTNILGYGPMNGFGTPEAVYAVDRLMDRAAEAIGMDPVDFRLHNCPRYGSRALDLEEVLGGPIHWGILGTDMDIFPELIVKTAEAAGWKEKWKGWRTPMAVDGYKRRGIGVGIGLHHTSVWPASAIVKMNQDGTANVLSGAVEIGQGYATAIAQVVAETLGIRYEDVNPVLADSHATPAAIGNVASNGTSSPINAAKIAAEDAKRKLFEIAAARLGAPAEALEVRDRKIFVKDTSKFVSIAEICLTGFQITGVGNNPAAHTIVDQATGKVIYSYASAVTFAEVEVDVETGGVELLRVVSGHDTGRTINPVIVDNQIDLGLIMGGGWLLSEEMLIDPKTGAILNANLIDYKIPTFMDIPKRDDLCKVVMEKECAWGPFGAKGFSESAITAIPGALANAIYNAAGVRIHAGSMIPRNILQALNAAEAR